MWDVMHCDHSNDIELLSGSLYLVSFNYCPGMISSLWWCHSIMVGWFDPVMADSSWLQRCDARDASFQQGYNKHGGGVLSWPIQQDQGMPFLRFPSIISSMISFSRMLPPRLERWNLSSFGSMGCKAIAFNTTSPLWLMLFAETNSFVHDAQNILQDKYFSQRNQINSDIHFFNCHL